MDVFDNLMLGFGVALTPGNLMYCLIGALIGTLIGVLPGIGPVATVAMLLPITFYLPPVSALIMLAGIYYGAQYGGSTTAILVNLPGESSSVVTCLDGYQMARQGRAGAALAVAALGSVFAGTVATCWRCSPHRWPRSRCCSDRPNTSRSWSSAWSPRSSWRRARWSRRCR
jgi:putative tricarboxylic transport membrane protein